MSNRITPFKNREIDYSLPVYIYRNLNCKGVSYSIRQKGLVVAHTDAIAIANAKFLVSAKGRERVQREKRKNVHAFIKGWVYKNGIMGANPSQEKEKLPLPAKIKYNPYNNLGFYCDNITAEPFGVQGAMGVIINRNGVFGAYLR